jgi:hypothetical protein
VRLESLSVSTNLRQKTLLIVRLGRHHFASLHVELFLSFGCCVRIRSARSSRVFRRASAVAQPLLIVVSLRVTSRRTMPRMVRCRTAVVTIRTANAIERLNNVRPSHVM